MFSIYMIFCFNLKIMESVHILTTEVVSNESLDSLIQNYKCVNTLNSLLQLKHRRILENSCEKIHFSINCIYQNNVNVDVATQILKYTLVVDADKSIHVQNTVKYCLNQFLSHEVEVFYALNLFNVVLENYKINQSCLNLTREDFDQFQNSLVTILKGQSKNLVTFILIYVLPNYLEVCEDRHELLTTLFILVTRTKKLEILCVCFNEFVSVNLNSSFNCVKNEDFWLLLIECIIDQQHSLRRQGIHLLSRSIEIVIKNPHSPLLPKFLTFEDEKIWENYLILLEVSSEKQLHIVEPSLLLFNTVKKLDFVWRHCLYRLFLNHSQNTIVYKTANFIVQNETEWHNFSEISTDLLSAVNKNEYNTDSTELFKQLGVYCGNFDTEKFEIFFTRSLSVPWVPAAIWGFYNNVFTRTKVPISLSLLEKIVTKLKAIPHKFIRFGCTKTVLCYFVDNFSVQSLDDVFKVSFILSCDESLFGKFLMKNEEKIREFENELNLEFLGESFERVEVALKVLQFLKIETPINKNSVFHLLLTDVPQSDIECYLSGKIDSVQNSELSHLLLLIEKLSSSILPEKAKILLQSGDNSQATLAFAILSKDSTDYKFLIKTWKDRFYADDRVTQILVKVLLDVNFDEEVIGILQDILDCQNSFTTITIIESLGNISPKVEFLEKCFDAFLTCNCSKNVSRKFISQLFSLSLPQKKLVEFLEKLLTISNTANSLAYLLSENLCKFIAEKPQTGITFVPLIVELILHGIIVNKNERVEYHVCQEIGLALGKDTCFSPIIKSFPNYEEISTRLLALESMLILVETNKTVTEEFVSVLVEKYKKHFGKRYFPDSQIHIEKMRILQTLILLQPNINDPKLVDLLVESFIQEMHQPSVRHLIQCLLILLTRCDSKRTIFLINEKLRTIDNNRPSTVSGLIPVFYHLVNESEWEQLVELLLPYTMGAQFKLRIFSQVALLKLYEKAHNPHFLEKYKFLYGSLKNVVNATGNNFDVANIHDEFLDYLDLKNCDVSAIFYTIPRHTDVTKIEWENLTLPGCLKHMKFNHTVSFTTKPPTPKNECISHNIQKKITPWKDLINVESNTDFILVTSLIEKPANLGGLSRTCEVFGIKKMVMRTSKIASDREFKSLSMSSENWVDIAEVKVENLRTFVLDVKKEGYSVVGAEQTSESVKLEQFQFPKKTVLVLGNEKAGVPADLIPLFDTCVEIPQFGMVRSLNVHVAGAIVMWEYCKQQRL